MHVSESFMFPDTPSGFGIHKDLDNALELFHEMPDEGVHISDWDARCISTAKRSRNLPQLFVCF